LGALVIAALEEAGHPMTLDELVEALEAKGFVYAEPPKDPHQLRASISSLPHKTHLIQRVGRAELGLVVRTG
jgi:hypothetical protein